MSGPRGRALFVAIDRLGIPRLALHIRQAHPTVVLYHGVHPRIAGDGIFNYRRKFILPQTLERELKWFRAHCHIVSPAEFAEAIRRRTTLPPRAVLITFDDGYANLYHHALPILRALGVPAVIFIPTDLVDKGVPLWFDRLEHAIGHATVPSLQVAIAGRTVEFPLTDRAQRTQVDRFLRAYLKGQPPQIRQDLLDEIVAAAGADLVPVFAASLYAGLTWAQVRQMQEAGQTFAPHTMSHPSLATLTADEASREIIGSRDLLRERAGAVARLFAYPYGEPADHTSETRRILRDSGFEIAFTTSARRVAPRDDPLAVPRISMDGTDDASVFHVTATGVRAMLWRMRGAVRPSHAPASAFFHSTATTYLTKYTREDTEGHSFRERKRLALAMLGEVAGLSVLDVGSGPGVIIDELLAGGAKITAIDIAPGMIHQLQIRYRHPRLTAEVGDIERLNLPDAAFDRVLVLGVLEYLRTDAHALSEVARVLKPGGEAIISFPNLHSPWRIWRSAVIAPVRFVVRVARRLRGREKTSVKSRHYSQEIIRQAVAAAHLDVMELIGYNMRLLPTPLDTLFPKATIRMAAALSRWGEGRLKWLGTSYIVRLRKPSDAAASRTVV